MPDLTQIKMPDFEDPLYAPFWQGARDGRIMVQCCGECETRRWPPRFMCWNCRSLDTKWVETAQEGRLYSWTVVGAASTKAYTDVPYVVAVVELEQEPPVRIVGYVADVDPESLAVGMELKARFVEAGPKGEITLIQWQPAQPAR